MIGSHAGMGQVPHRSQATRRQDEHAWEVAFGMRARLHGYIDWLHVTNAVENNPPVCTFCTNIAGRPKTDLISVSTDAGREAAFAQAGSGCTSFPSNQTSKSGISGPGWPISPNQSRPKPKIGPQVLFPGLRDLHR